VDQPLPACRVEDRPEPGDVDVDRSRRESLLALRGDVRVVSCVVIVASFFVSNAGMKWLRTIAL